MPRNRLGELRRSAVVSTFGPGAIIDFRAGDAPVSVVAAGLEEWDRRATPPGLNNEQTVFEPRLQKKLNVKGFRLPPVMVDEDDSSTTLVGVRFPEWLQCPECNVIRRAGMWSKAPGEAGRWCGTCTAKAPGNRRVFAVPVRVISACENGHLDEFPWHHWAGHKPDCERRGDLILKSNGPGLAGLVLRCPACGSSRPMDGIFSKRALERLKCRGRRPWLAGPEEECTCRPRVLQRGASNLYFPVTHSALDIPPWSDSIQKLLGQYWDPIVNVEDPAQRAQFVGLLYPLMGLLNMSVEALIQQVEQRLQVLSSVDPDNLRWDEYLQFTSGRATAVEEDTEFEIRLTTVPDTLAPYFERIVRAVRLREVRALNAFTRIHPPSTVSEGGPVQRAPIQKGQLPWLPAIEVRGEGIFLTLNRDRLHAWERLPAVQERARQIDENYRADCEERFGRDTEVEVDRSITARFLLLHALAHALMRQLALECGYSSASLRERLFVGDAPIDMCGVLIYTATSDSDGTLGGLVRQGLRERMEELVPAAIASLRWCSSDPLCVDDRMSISEPMNLAACHACILAPETSCEEYNRFLDRALLVGQPDRPQLGFFTGIAATGAHRAEPAG